MGECLKKKILRMSQSKEVVATENPPEQTPRDRAVGKRPLAPSFENMELCKKMRAEAESPNHVQDLFAQVKSICSEGMEPFKGVSSEPSLFPFSFFIFI